MTRHKIILLFLITLFLIPNVSNGQEESVVALKPILGQGYLVLNKTNYPDIDHWDIDIIKRSHGEGEYQDQIIESEELPQNINYMFIPIDYRRQSTAVNYLVDIRGVNNNGQTIVTNNRVQLNDNNGPSYIEQRTDGSLPAQRECEVTCISGDYAYAIAQYRFPNQNPHLVLEQVLRSFDVQAQVANAYYKYSNLQCNVPEADCYGPITNTLPAVFYDQGGNPLSGNIYARRKKLGPWDDLSLVSTQLSTSICSPSLSINTAINVLEGSLNYNLSPTSHLPLECVPANNIAGGNGNGGNDGDISNTGGGPRNIDVVADFFDSFCIDEIGFPIEPSPGDNVCNGNVIGGDLLDPIREILIYDLNTNTQPVIINIFQNPHELAFDLEPSLYSFGFVFNDGDFVVGIKEFKNEFSYEEAIREGSLIAIDIFPTPIIENQFQIHMEPQATMSFKYELRDTNGMLLVDKTFEVEEGNNIEELINGIEIPRGLLFHVFRFQDGSIKTFKSFK